MLTIPGNNEELKTYRYERKIVISGQTRSEIEHFIKLHSSFFSEIHHQRWVNNIYFDHLNFKNYYDNVEGINSRTKVRIRWYGPLKGECSKPVLEIKRKEGSLGQKQAYPLKSFVFNDALTHEKLNRILHTSELPDAVRSALSPLIPVMVNRYSRNYFQSSNRKFRLTLDSSQHYFRFNKLQNRFGRGIENKEELVLELKYAFEDDKQAMSVSSIIPFRISKNSKYINGINQLYRV